MKRGPHRECDFIEPPPLPRVVMFSRGTGVSQKIARNYNSRTPDPTGGQQPYSVTALTAATCWFLRRIFCCSIGNNGHQTWLLLSSIDVWPENFRQLDQSSQEFSCNFCQWAKYPLWLFVFWTLANRLKDLDHQPNLAVAWKNSHPLTVQNPTSAPVHMETPAKVQILHMEFF